MILKKKKLAGFSLALAVALSFYAVWTRTGRQAAAYQPLLHLPEAPVAVESSDTRALHVVLIQPYMLPEDYASHGNFFAKMEGYFQQAQAEGHLSGNALVVLPEHIGTWLVVAEEKRGAIEAASFRAAGWLLAASNPVRYLRYFVAAPPGAKRHEFALFRMKSASMQTIYHQTFSTLAKRHGVFIAAGSIVLPDVYVEEGIIHTRRRGGLFNTSVLYHPDGLADSLPVKKKFPTLPEAGFVVAGGPEDIPVFDLPGSKVAVVFGADSQQPAAGAHLKKKGVGFVAAISFGKNGEPAERYDGCRVFFQGKMWDMENGGTSSFFKNGKMAGAASSGEAFILSECF
jgi:predicted amidohydrolase